MKGWHREVCLCSQVSSRGEFGRKFFVRPNSKSTCDTDKFQPGPAGASSRKVKESIRFPARKLIRSRWNSGLLEIVSLQAERGTLLLVGMPWPGESDPGAPAASLGRGMHPTHAGELGGLKSAQVVPFPICSVILV